MVNSTLETKHKNGTYCSIGLSDQSRSDIEDFVKTRLNLSTYIDPSEYHVTLCYSKNPVIVAEKLVDFSGTILGIGKCLTQFETKIMNEKYCLVLEVISDDLTYINNALKLNGATSDYPTYKPHITLAYSETEFNFSDSIQPMINLEFSGITVEGLKDEIEIKTKEN